MSDSDEDKKINALYKWLDLQVEWSELIGLYNTMPMDCISMDEIDPEWANRYEDAMNRLKAVIDEVYDESCKAELEYYKIMGWNVEKLAENREIAEKFVDAVAQGMYKAAEIGLLDDEDEDKLKTAQEEKE